jgi:regulator of protease activity HflC (stomatin/prohibitin superfamily)
MSEDVKNDIAATAIVCFVILLILAVIFGAFAGLKAFGRMQARANASNQVKITHINIEKAGQEAAINHAQIKAQEAEAQKRIVEARGIAEATRIVDRTLTPLYVQHEAILAQKEIATSGKNNTVIYVPAGTNGTPLITQSGNPNHSAGAGPSRPR